MYIINEAIRIEKGVAILPINILNTQTGKNRFLGNIYETWDINNTTVEFWSLIKEGYNVAIITSGNKPLYDIDDEVTFKHDQNGRKLFTAKMLGFCLLKDLKKQRIHMSQNINAYVYK